MAMVGPEPLGPHGDQVASGVYETILHNLPDTTVFVFGPDLRYQLVEGGGLQRSGWSPREIIGRRPSELLADGSAAADLEESMRAALAGRTSRQETAGLRQDDLYWESTVSPLTDHRGEVIGGLIVSRNLGALRPAEADRSKSQQEAARWSRTALVERRLRERIEFLAGIDGVLGNCRDRRQIMQAVVAAAVPRLGDWCSVHVLMEPHDTAPVVEVGHADPALVQRATRLVEAFPFDPEAAYGVPRVMRTGQPELRNDLDADALEALVADSFGIEAIRQLGLTSSLIVPLAMRGRTFGALTFSVSGRGRVLDEDDLALAVALAGRVAASLDNRRLTEVERHISATLQNSLLPSHLPDIPGLEVAVRYWAAGEGTQVGGDFYDVFDTGHGCHAVVLGDVCGSGPAAAAVTSTVRYTVRALARRGDEHATVLHQLNDALLASWPDVFCTVVYATLTPAGADWRLVAVSGGHPLPIVVRPGGQASTVGRPGMLIGALPIPDPDPFELELVPGDTVVFYTDGAYDLPPPQYLSEEDLVALVAASAAPDPAEAVADGIARRLEAVAPFEERDDDVALVVVRVVPARQP